MSGKQEVLLTSKLSNSTLWQIDNNDAKIRFDAMGHQVLADQPLLIRHIGTSQWLATDHFVFVSYTPIL
jgi:hypothetical protein